MLGPTTSSLQPTSHASQDKTSLWRPAARPDTALAARRLVELRTVLVATPQYLEAHGTPRRFEDLRDHELVRDLKGDLRARQTPMLGVLGQRRVQGR